MTDPDTPFLHVGMNAPRADREDSWIQRRYTDQPLKTKPRGPLTLVEPCTQSTFLGYSQWLCV